MDATRILDRAPRWLRAVALATSKGRGPLGWLTDRIVHRYRTADIPSLPEERGTTVRLLIGPANEVEQGFQWARSAELLPGVSATAMMGFDPGGYDVRSDIRVAEAVYLRAPDWHVRFESYLRSRTHVIFESGLPLLGRAYRSDAFREVRMLQDAGVAVAFLWHGSDIRPPGLHALATPWSPFHDPEVPTAFFTERVAHNAGTAGRLSVPQFVSTPDLLRWVEGATWCPVVIAPGEWVRARARWGSWSGRRPVVAHAPSSTRIKGTERLEPVVERLARAGLLEYRRVTGVPHARMPDVYAGADIVLDQFLIGGYGVAALEAVAAGCLVVGHVDEETRSTVRRLTGREIPVVQSTIDDLERVLRDIIEEPSSFADTRASGPDFVRAVHDGRRSAEALAEFLGVTD